MKSGRIIFLMVLLGFVAAGCQTRVIQTVQEETEANEILDLLLSYDIPASKAESESKQDPGFEIRIDGGEQTYKAALILMEDHCLPRELPKEIEKSGLISSPTEEKARVLRRNVIEIESQLRRLPGTTCVDVNIVRASMSELSGEDDSASATVLVKYKSKVFGKSRSEIARMVAGGVPGLDADKVVVSLTKQDLRKLPDFKSEAGMGKVLVIVMGTMLSLVGVVAIVLVLRQRRIKGESRDLVSE